MSCHFIAVGEGHSDLGVNALDTEGVKIREGVMMLVANSVAVQSGSAEPTWKLYSRNEVSAIIKADKRSIGDRGGNKGVAGEILMRAWCLGKMAVKGRCCALVFSDVDSTHSHGEKFSDLWRAAEYGFNKAGCSTGVPMISNPRSEAWLLSYYQGLLPKNHVRYHKSYEADSVLEGLSGNDSAKSKNNAKVILKEALENGNLDMEDVKKTSLQAGLIG